MSWLSELRFVPGVVVRPVYDWVRVRQTFMDYEFVGTVKQRNIGLVVARKDVSLFCIFCSGTSGWVATGDMEVITV